jgi:hypothetical protein
MGPWVSKQLTARADENYDCLPDDRRFPTQGILENPSDRFGVEDFAESVAATILGSPVNYGYAGSLRDSYVQGVLCYVSNCR